MNKEEKSQKEIDSLRHKLRKANQTIRDLTKSREKHKAIRKALAEELKEDKKKTI